MVIRKHRDDSTVTVGSGNVYADLGFRDADEMLAKAQLVDAIRTVIGERHLTQQGAAALVGLTQPKISALLAGDTKGFSCDRLMRILRRLGHNITITLASTPNGAPGFIRVA
jgi:predicted XRE-type DNA-binding protein